MSNKLTGHGFALVIAAPSGAGKTSLTQGVVQALGGGEVTSPTFSLVQEYRGEDFDIFCLLFWLDEDRVFQE